MAAEDVALDTGLAKCRTCNNVFRFDNLPELAAPAVRPRQNVGRPRSVATWEDDGGLTVQYRWFSPKYIAMAAFCLFWDGFLVFWYLMAWDGHTLSCCSHPHLAAGTSSHTRQSRVRDTTTRESTRAGECRAPPSREGTGSTSRSATGALFCDEKITRGRRT